MYDLTFGEIVTVLRRRKGMKEIEVAELVGVSKPHVGKIERGLTEPSLLVRWKLLAVLAPDFPMKEIPDEEELAKRIGTRVRALRKHSFLINSGVVC